MRRLKRGLVPGTKFDRTHRLLIDLTDLLFFLDLATLDQTEDRGYQIRKLGPSLSEMASQCFESPGELKPLYLTVLLMGRMTTYMVILHLYFEENTWRRLGEQCDAGNECLGT